jgi:hypothetical protein
VGWEQQGNCYLLGVQPKVFYPDGHKEKDIATAKFYCRPCRVIDECLEAAIARNEPDGIWGGKTTEERAAFSTTRFLRTVNNTRVSPPNKLHTQERPDYVVSSSPSHKVDLILRMQPALTAEKPNGMVLKLVWPEVSQLQLPA